eukprot:TRINITY_DN26862_c0_g1_i1.p1 TRINITY_DN26862_c0_g1~~TRINITY_DN26862_c0_g1_i1.p1  ORF type:complete len:174 (+),score=43.77 TRINITY_DN26862_c0_g1_i1:24-524(+)
MGMDTNEHEQKYWVGKAKKGRVSVIKTETESRKSVEAPVVEVDEEDDVVIHFGEDEDEEEGEAKKRKLEEIVTSEQEMVMDYTNVTTRYRPLRPPNHPPFTPSPCKRCSYRPVNLSEQADHESICSALLQPLPFASLECPRCHTLFTFRSIYKDHLAICSSEVIKK